MAEGSSANFKTYLKSPVKMGSFPAYADNGDYGLLILYMEKYGAKGTEILNK